MPTEEQKPTPAPDDKEKPAPDGGGEAAVPLPGGDIPPPRRFLTGARPTPREKLESVPILEARRAAPAQIAWVAPRLSTWNNSQYGDCVTAEECYSKGAWTGHHYVTESECVRWANEGGYLNGATLVDVLDDMMRRGLRDEKGVERRNGPYSRVRYDDETALKTAIAVGPVKLGMASSCLPADAGNKQGWTAFGSCRPGYLDHSTTVSGYGPAKYLAEQHGFALPSGVDPAKPCYAYFTWGSVGLVDFAWLKASTDEAYVRNPTTVGETPGPEPEPPPPPPGPGPVLPFLLCVLDGVRSGKGFVQAIIDCLRNRSEEDVKQLLRAPLDDHDGHCAPLREHLDNHVTDWLHGNGTLTAGQLVDTMLDLPCHAVEPFTRLLQVWQMQMKGVLPTVTPSRPARR